MERRDFIKICAATAAAGVRPVSGAGDLRPRFYARALLVEGHRQPLKAASLATGRNYIFHYPFEATPCFLLNLGRPTLQRVTPRTTDGNRYECPGAWGPTTRSSATRRSARTAWPTRLARSASSVTATVQCRRRQPAQYDPLLLGTQRIRSRLWRARDGRPRRTTAVGDPARTRPQCGHAPCDRHAGQRDVRRFFEKFEFKLTLDYGASRVKSRVGGQSIVTGLENFCKQRARC